MMMNAVISAERGMRNLVKISELTEGDRKVWMELVDEVVLTSDEDKELKEGLHFLDEEATHRKIDIYDMILKLYEKDELDKKIRDWKKAKGYA